jgi:hypothetical protein
MIGIAVQRNGRIAIASLQRGRLGHFPEEAVAELNRQREEHDSRPTRS